MRSGRQRGSMAALAVGAGSMLLAPGLSHAQSSGGGLGPGPTGPASAPGAPAGGKRFTLDVIGAILYDSNVSKGQNTVTATRKLHKSEVTYAPGVAVATFLPLGRNLVYLNGSVGYDFREYNKQLESGRANVRAGGVARLGPCEADAGLGYSVQQSNLADLPVNVTRNRQTTQSANTQLMCAAGTGFTGFVGAQAARTSNSADADLIDSKTYGASGGVGYGNRQLGTLQVIGGYSKSSYDESANPLVMKQPGFNSYMVGLQYSRAFGNRLNGNASVGYQFVKSDRASVKNSSNVTGSGSLDYKLNSRTGISLRYSRAAAPSIIEGYDYILNQSYNLEGRYNLSSRLQSSLGARWSQTDYKGASPIVLTVPTNQKVRTLFAQTSVKLGRTASVALTGSQEKRTAEQDLFNYTAYQVGVTAKKSF